MPKSATDIQRLTRSEAFLAKVKVAAFKQANAVLDDMNRVEEHTFARRILLEPDNVTLLQSLLYQLAGEADTSEASDDHIIENRVNVNFPEIAGARKAAARAKAQVDPPGLSGEKPGNSGDKPKKQKP